MLLNPWWSYISSCSGRGGVGQEVGGDDLDTEQMNNDDACTDNFEADTDNVDEEDCTATQL